MSVRELLSYTGGERDRWEEWFAGQPSAALSAPVQRVGQYSTVWEMLTHIFLVEKRHTERLSGAPHLTESTGIPEFDVSRLFAFGRVSRAELEALIGVMTAEEAARIRTLAMRDGRTYTFSARKLVLHVFLHEIRHWAQIAMAVRNAGFPPPGGHDLLASTAVS